MGIKFRAKKLALKYNEKIFTNIITSHFQKYLFFGKWYDIANWLMK